MAFENKQQTETSGREQKQLPGKLPASVQESAGVPNSLVMRDMEDPGDPKDGSSPAPVSFRHELRHTIRQRPVPVRTFVPLPGNVIQRENGKKNKNLNDLDDWVNARDEIEEAEWTRLGDRDQDSAGASERENGTGPLADLENDTLMFFLSSRAGKDVFTKIRERLENLIQGFTRKKKEELTFSLKGDVCFMVRLFDRNYVNRDILKEILQKPIQNEQEANERGREFLALIMTAARQAQPSEMEMIAEDSGLVKGIKARPGNQDPSRPYDAAPDDPGGSAIGRTIRSGDRILQKVYDEIDQAATPEEAYQAFAAFAGNPHARLDETGMIYRDPSQIRMDIFRARMKHMARQVRDFPEMKRRIGDMYEIANNSTSEAETRFRSVDDPYADLGFHPERTGDTTGIVSNQNDQSGYFTATKEFTGNHELGHVLGHTLVARNPATWLSQTVYGEQEGKVLEKALRSNPGMRFNQYNMHKPVSAFTKYAADSRGKKQGQIDVTDPYFNQHPETRENYTPADANKKSPYVDPDAMSDPAKERREMADPRFLDQFFALDPTDRIGTWEARVVNDALQRGKYNEMAGRGEKARPAAAAAAAAAVPDVQNRPDPTKKPTSGYGVTNAKELLAEASADIYAHRDHARPMSIALMKAYEEIQKERQRRLYEETKRNIVL